ncbi:hypothetical protein M422DRAFT_255329 [Sphaerobolus stellatus SS14]|uniref:Uncharacterized protein n=1 Tax=Sphaerobolus stellatus (strain SS14) TaxID=990650 RepID=A0A0C9VT62_SPHS4|nr:hypothetical protein M422DRAFT_255329 [Sphaerobolus stellatus SS14]
MHFQLSAIFSLSVLAVSTMASQQVDFLPGVTLTFADGNTEHFNFDTCILAHDASGSAVDTAVFTESAICNVYNQAKCEGTSEPIEFPPFVPIPNPFVGGFIVNSARCVSN